MTKQRQSLADRAYDAIEALIVAGELAPGQRIAESAVAERVGLGRTPVREAIQRLAGHHLVEIATGRQLRVAEIDVREQLLIVELQRQVELLLVRRALRNAGTADRRELRAIAADLEAAVDAARVQAAGRALERTLVRLARHRFAAEAAAPLWSASRRFAWVHRALDDPAVGARLLRTLMAAIADGDEAAAERATLDRMDHLDRFARATLEPAG
ncbi:MAG: GntR family transcriptional regulator [Alphaproteobacteria bacterium]